MDFIDCFRPMRIAFVAITLFVSNNVSARNPAITDLTDQEFQSLAEKTNLYVKALNAASSVQRSYDQYASWVNVKKGPTGKENYISYGLYQINGGSVNEWRQRPRKGQPCIRRCRTWMRGGIKAGWRDQDARASGERG